MKRQILALVATIFVATVPAANAAYVTYALSGEANLIPLDGFFTVDTQQVEALGGNGAGMFSDMRFTWDGNVFDLTNGDSAAIRYDEFGNLDYVAFGSDCVPGGCVGDSGSPSWFLASDGQGRGTFFVNLTGTNAYFGPASYALVDAVDVPEPGTLSLVALAALLIFASRRPPLTAQT